jgi:dCTP deaminase
MPLLSPFYERTEKDGTTFGLSPAGYDVRVEFRTGDRCIMSKGSFLLASTMEKFHIPNDVMGIVHDKSSWARLGLTVQNTVIEPGWFGYLTLELINHGPKKITIMAGCGIAQIVFHKLDKRTIHPYAGKYQGQSRGPHGRI